MFKSAEIQHHITVTQHNNKQNKKSYNDHMQETHSNYPKLSIFC